VAARIGFDITTAAHIEAFRGQIAGVTRAGLPDDRQRHLGLLVAAIA
jgi:hypothetical protein